MTDYFGNSYWSARYFASGYWGLNVEQEPGAISARVSGSSSVSAVLSLAGEQPQAATPTRLIPLQALFRAWRVSVVVPLRLSARVAGRSDVRAVLEVIVPASASVAGVSAVRARLTAAIPAAARVLAVSGHRAKLVTVDRLVEHNNLMWLLAA